MKLHSVLSALALCMGLSLLAQAPQQQQPPPELAELQAAMAITDLQTRIKEFQRLKTAYPNSRFASTFDTGILAASTNLADSLDKVLSVQKEIIAGTKSFDRVNLIIGASQLIMKHPKLDSFPKDGVLKAIRDYKAQAVEFFADPEVIGQIPENRRSETLGVFNNLFEIQIAKAQLLSGDAKAALATIEEYGKEQKSSEEYYSVLGDVHLSLALEAFFGAIIEGDEDAVDKAKKLYATINGDASKFDAELERRKSELPFHPPAFVVPADWKGKAVLAEIFTGSECPPCVGADLAFDGLIETYPSKYLVVLEYHLPIPRYDPMMNTATEKRQSFYGIRSTPSAAIDGTQLQPGGGGRAAAETLYGSYKKEIDPRLLTAPDVTISASAVLVGENVKVDCVFSKIVKGAEYNVVLVQSVEDFKGGNGIKHHKMVVRDIKTVKPATKASVSFNITESEKSADSYITEWGKTASQSRINGSPWPVKQNKIDRSGLKAVVFVQDTNTKQVLNAFVTDVKTK